MSTLFTFLGGFFREGTSESSQRLVTVVGTFCILGTWARISWAQSQLIPFSESVIVVLGLLLGSKIGSKYLEQKNGNSKNGNGKTNEKTPPVPSPAGPPPGAPATP